MGSTRSLVIATTVTIGAAAMPGDGSKTFSMPDTATQARKHVMSGRRLRLRTCTIGWCSA